MKEKQKKQYLRFHAALCSILTLIVIASLTTTTIKTVIHANREERRKKYQITKELSHEDTSESAYYLEAINK